MHITRGASAYLEVSLRGSLLFFVDQDLRQNVWLWNADHSLDDGTNETKIDVFSGRGFLVEGTNIWMVGTASEHHLIYQYRFSGAQNVYAGLIQTETPYFQPDPRQ